MTVLRKRTVRLWVTLSLVLLMGVRCAPAATPLETVELVATFVPPTATEIVEVAQMGKYMPPAGKTLLIVGQDLGSVAGYVEHVWEIPGGITTYTDLSENAHSGMLYGLEDVVNYGSGDVSARASVENYPQSTLVIGLYLVDQTGANLEHLADGTHDDEIDRLGRFIQNAARPVFLRIGYEFDGPWNHYKPETYIATFRHIVTRLREQGVGNFASVWQSATAGDTYRDQPIAAWYPGDEYVDWCGTSYFHFNRSAHDEMLDFARAHEKPVLIAESAPRGYDLAALTYSDDGHLLAERSAQQIWDAWFEPYFEYIHANRDVIRAVAYINCEWQAQALWGGPGSNTGYWGDSRIEANATLQALWLGKIKAANWLHGSRLLFEILQFEE